MSGLTINTVVNGKWKQNCYLLFNSDLNALLIDPGSDSEIISSRILELELNLLGILNTHAHYDHIGAVANLQEKFKAPFYINLLDEKLMRQANLYRIIFDGAEYIKIPKIDVLLPAHDLELVIGPFRVRSIFTPGHTEGGTSFLIDNFLFSGDTLMYSGPGRVDLPGGNVEKLNKSIMVLKELNPDILIYPGHGKPFLLRESWLYE
jgi:glyoxylase-like metal-dependent hydrolase (beta-lactamase superfamily II)